MQSVEQKLTELYLANAEMIGEGFPAPLNSARNAIVQSLRLGRTLPAAKDERYHLTDIAALYSGDWEYYFTPPARPIPGERLYGGEIEGASIELSNGFCTTGFFVREDGMAYGGLALATRGETEDIVLKNYNSATAQTLKNGERETEALAAVNTLMAQDGAFIYVPDGMQAEAPIVIDCRYLSAGEEVACFTRTLVVVGAGARAEVVLMHRGGEGAGLLANSVCEVVLGQGAQIKLSEFCDMNSESTLLHSNFITQQAGSNVEAVCTAIGGQTTRIYHQADLHGSQASTSLDGLYLARNRERMDFNVRINHLAPDCTSREMVKGVASGEAIGSFTGLVYVARDAQRTDARQQSRNIELSDKAKIYTRPQLEIYADDVKCSHGATVGQLDAEAVYYMRQRGIDLDTARKLQLEGFIKDVTAHYDYGQELFNDLIQIKLQ